MLNVLTANGLCLLVKLAAFDFDPLTNVSGRPDTWFLSRHPNIGTDLRKRKRDYKSWKTNRVDIFLKVF